MAGGSAVNGDRGVAADRGIDCERRAGAHASRSCVSLNTPRAAKLQRFFADNSSYTKETIKMDDQFPPASWFLRPNTLAHWMPNMFWGGVLAAPTSAKRSVGSKHAFWNGDADWRTPCRVSHGRTGRRRQGRTAGQLAVNRTTLGSGALPLGCTRPRPWGRMADFRKSRSGPVRSGSRRRCPALPRCHSPLRPCHLMAVGTKTALRGCRRCTQAVRAHVPGIIVCTIPKPCRSANRRRTFETRQREALSDANVRYYLGPGFYEAYRNWPRLPRFCPAPARCRQRKTRLRR